MFTLLLSFTGYLLPWDQLALWAVTVGTNMMWYTPVFGEQVRFVLLGGEIGTDTLLCQYVLNLLLPFVSSSSWRSTSGEYARTAASQVRLSEGDRRSHEVPEHLESAEEARAMLQLRKRPPMPWDAPAELLSLNSRRRHPRFRLTCLSGPKRPRPRWLTAAMPVAVAVATAPTGAAPVAGAGAHRTWWPHGAC